METKVYVELIYSDDTSANFEVTMNESEASNKALAMMITRGTLMASMAKTAHCYNAEGFEICSYIK